MFAYYNAIYLVINLMATAEFSRYLKQMVVRLFQWNLFRNRNKSCTGHMCNMSFRMKSPRDDAYPACVAVNIGQ